MIYKNSENVVLNDHLYLMNDFYWKLNELKEILFFLFAIILDFNYFHVWMGFNEFSVG